MEAAKAFFAQAHAMAEEIRQQVVTDGHTSYPRAISEDLGVEVKHKVKNCLGSPIEQSHPGVKQRYYLTLEFG